MFTTPRPMTTREATLTIQQLSNSTINHLLHRQHIVKTISHSKPPTYLIPIPKTKKPAVFCQDERTRGATWIHYLSCFWPNK